MSSMRSTDFRYYSTMIAIGVSFQEQLLTAQRHEAFISIFPTGWAKSFSAAFADAYEEYMRQLCVDFLGSERVITEKIERGLGWDGKTNDLTLILGEAAILLECKNSGLFSLSKRTAEVVDLASDIRKNLANAEKRKGLFQLYDKIEAIRLGQVPEKVKALYANVGATSIPWCSFTTRFGMRTSLRRLRSLLISELRKNGIVDFDYQIWHVEEFQTLCQAGVCGSTS